MASDKAQLLEMGFDEARVAWALRETKNAGLQPALDYIIAHMDSPVPDASAGTGAAGAEGDDEDEDDSEALKAHIAKMKAGGDATAGNGEALARSVKCSECGKIFKNADLVSFHAEKSGHSNFEESTEEYVPLTEEQRKAKLDDLRVKLAEKRAKQALVNVEENKANEKLRRKAGQDSIAIKQALERKEMEKDLAAKKKEKLEDARAKAAIKAQIELDKQKRAEKAAREKAIREGQPVPDASSSTPQVGTSVAKATSAAGTGMKGKDFPETRLQVRLSTGGAPLVKSFKSDAPLSEVAEWIASESLEFDAAGVKLSTTFPRKLFTPADMSKSLRENGLTPSALPLRTSTVLVLLASHPVESSSRYSYATRQGMRRVMEPRNVVAVCGTTGVGKSAFAVELARSLRRGNTTTSNGQDVTASVLSDSTPNTTRAAVPTRRDGPTTTTTTGRPVPIRGVVLSADSMQLYEGLEVITNKVTEGEMRGVEHWGVGGVGRSPRGDEASREYRTVRGDAVDPGKETTLHHDCGSTHDDDGEIRMNGFRGVTVGEGSWEVGRWVTEAWRKIESLNPLTDLPIICGGTHYYTQHFLFPPARLNLDRSSVEGSKSNNTKWRPPCTLAEVLDTLDRTDREVSERIRIEPGVREFLETFWTPSPIIPDSWRAGPDGELLALHRLLGVVDAGEAGRWHWRDGRKVRRGLERWWEGLEGVTRGKGDVQPERSRFRTLMFWVYDDLESLAPRLDSRVDKMVELGLIDEIKQLREQAVRIYGTEQDIDHQEGIFQSIGYKEFSHIPTDRLTPADPLFAPALERMKISTRQYAKRQLKWVQKQMLPVVKQARERGDEVWVYVVRGGDADTQLGEELLHRFLNHEPMPDYRAVGHPKAAELLRVLDSDEALVPEIEQRQVLNARLECDICSTPGQPVTIIKSEWEAHLKSKSHRRSKFRWEQENGLGRDFTAVREEAARRKATKDEEARLAKERLEQDESLGIA